MVVMVLLVFVICCSPVQLLMAHAIIKTDEEVTGELVLILDGSSQFVTNKSISAFDNFEYLLRLHASV